MSQSCFFVGGAHGSGKTKLCKAIQKKLGCSYISASELLQWEKEEKTVDDVAANQKKLKTLLNDAVKEKSFCLIDGHFALWNKDYNCELVPLDFFEDLNLGGIIFVLPKIEEIQSHLYERDHILFPLDQIKTLVDTEYTQAESTAKRYGVPFYVIDSSNDEQVEKITATIGEIMLEKYTRKNIYSKILKKVIVRGDFFEIAGVENFVEKEKVFLSEYFSDRYSFDQDQQEIVLSPSKFEKNVFPLSKTYKKRFFRFEGFKKQSIKVVLDISSEFFCLDITCQDNYRGSQVFTDLVCSLIQKLRSFDPFTTFYRIGFRKIDMPILEDWESVATYFNSNFLVGISWSKLPKKDFVSMSEKIKKGNVSFNIAQRIDYVVKDGIPKTRLIYDIDSYIEKKYIAECLQNNSLMDCFDKEMQDEMFYFFRSVASIDYLEKCLRAKIRLDHE